MDARITAKKAGIELSIDSVEAHFLAGGNVVPTVQALIAAQKAGIELNWDRACAIDLATKGSGKSVVEAVRTSVDPKVIDCPNPEGGRTTIDGVAAHTRPAVCRPNLCTRPSTSTRIAASVMSYSTRRSLPAIFRRAAWLPDTDSCADTARSSRCTRYCDEPEAYTCTRGCVPW